MSCLAGLLRHVVIGTRRVQLPARRGPTLEVSTPLVDKERRFPRVPMFEWTLCELAEQLREFELFALFCAVCGAEVR